MNAPSALVHPKNALLEKQVEEHRRQIRTDGYAMSVGELASLYEAGEMEMQPRFQRFFRWTVEQKTSLVESVLLGIPLPQIFVSQRNDGIWEVINGLQCISALFEFMGNLKDEKGEVKPPLHLTEPKSLPNLKGHSWPSLPQALKLDFRRAKVNVSIIMRGGDVRAKYDLFERLNAGGSPFSSQDVRNCILVMENEEFYRWLETLAEIPSFRECVAISEKLQQEAYHLELASRLLIFSEVDTVALKGDLGPFVTDRMVEMAREHRDDKASLCHRRHVFESVFRILTGRGLGENVFKKFSVDDDRFEGPFLISLFEVIGCGIAYHLSHGADAKLFQSETVLSTIRNMWNKNSEIRESACLGHTGSYRLRTTIPLGRHLFALR